MTQTTNGTAGLCAGEQRIALATVIAYQIGKDLNPQQLSELITFINVINAQLALLASTKQASLSGAAAQGGSTAGSALDSDAILVEDIDISALT